MATSDAVVPSANASASTSRASSPPRIEASAFHPQSGEAPGSPRSLAVSNMAELGVDCSWEDSDHFYMYVYKVMMCPKKFSHEWSACPFAHKGERATRRDPRQVSYCATACPDFKGGPCPRGEACPQSHGVFEACLHPERYKTQLCNSGSNCRRSVCFFAHALPELRTPVCQPVTPETSPVPPARPSAVHELLGVPVAANQNDMLNMMLDPTAANQNEILRAQLLQFQQAFASLSSCLAMPGLQGQLQPQLAAASLMASQLQSAQSFTLQTAVPDQWSCGATACGIQPADRLAHELVSKMSVSELSPRTPLDAPDMYSPASQADTSTPWSAGYASKAAGRYSLFPDDLYPESNLPSGLFDGY